MRPILLALTALLAAAQDFPTESKVLSLAREQVLNTTHSLPRYTCIETIERAYMDPAKTQWTNDRACPVIASKDSPTLRIRATDRLRLEVAVAEGGEIDSWPHASQFDPRGIDIVQSGPISSGAFGINLEQAFQNPGAKFQFLGSETRDGRTIFRYHYTVPLDTSTYMVKMFDGMRWKTAYSGDLEIVAGTSELTRLTIETAPLSPESGMCRAKTTNVYHHVKVGSGDFLIPVTSTLQTVRPDGTATESLTTFSGCHEYTAESTIRFDIPDDQPSAASGAAVETNPLPGAVRIGLRLDSAIDTEKAAAGDFIYARIEKAVRNPKTNKVVPAGTRIRGRVTQAMHYLSGDRGFDIDFAFDSLQIGQNTIPFAGVAISGKPRVPGLNVSLSGTGTGGVLKIRTRDEKVVIPTGVRFEWMTLTPPKPKS